MNYNEKKEFYTKNFSIGNFTSAEGLSERLILISLITLVYLKTKEKDDEITVLKILMQITGQKADNSGFYQVLENLSILIEDLSYDVRTADACGLTTSKDIIKKIKEILNSWIPF